MIDLDGSYGSGGGQIIRTALALSTITQKPFEVNDIRKGRPKSGLKAQHLHGIKGIQQLCDAKAEGAELGSEYLKFEPSRLKSKNLHIDIGTAGSMTLILQSLLMPSMFGNKKIVISLIGGSDCSWSPPFDYLKEVFLPQIRKFADIDIKLIKRGYYPKGNGKIELKITPKYRLEDFKDFKEFRKNLKENAPKINLTGQYNLIQVRGVSHASFDLQKVNVAERQAQAAQLTLNKHKCPINIDTQYSETLSTGSGITLWAIFSKDDDEIDIKNPIRIGADSLGERGKKAELVGQEAANNLIKEIESKAPVDHYLADQLLPFMALAGGSKIKTSKITNHCKTNIYVIERFLGRIFEISEKENIISTIN